MAREDENKDRGNWDKKADYLLSCIGYAVGLGNVWRFPYLAYRNGGGAFLIPYVIMLAFAGLPIFFMECALGQFTSLGPTSAWKFNPLFKGVGICMVILSALVGIYYNVIIAYTVFYFFSSLSSAVPWATCDNWWNDANTCSTEFEKLCYPDVSSLPMTQRNQFLANTTMYNETVPLTIVEELAMRFNVSAATLNCSEANATASRGTSPSEEYWEKYVLHRAENMEPENAGPVRMQLALSLLVAWIVVFYSLIKGVKSSGKVVYFTALFPYVVLLILLIRGATLPGAWNGIQFYIGSESDFSRLADAGVWKDAATQIFFSLSAAWGGLVALSSYNRFNNNCFYDSLIVCLTNCGTSLFAGFAIFTIVGHMAYKLGRPVPEVVDSGFGLAFIAYPEAIALLPGSSAWAILFFLMLFTLGLDSQFTILETVATAVIDAFPSTLRNRRWQLTLILAVVMFCLGLTCVTNTGIYYVNLVDHYSAGWGLLIVAVLECIGICWIYGGNRFIKDIEMMIGEQGFLFWLFWRACWFFITPLLLLAVLIWSLITFKPASYSSYEYPTWAEGLGWASIGFGLIFVPGMAIYAIAKHRGNIFKASSPEDDWGPYLQKFRGLRYANMKEPVEALALKEKAERTNAAYEPEPAASKPPPADDQTAF